MTTDCTTMNRESQSRYDIRPWINAEDQLEVKVYDHKHHRLVAHLVETETKEPTESGVYASVWHDIRSDIREGRETSITLKFFEEIDREAHEHTENTLYWNFDSDSFGWARHPLRSWKSMAAEGEFIAFENKHRDELLERTFDGLRQEYMEDCEVEMYELLS